MEKWAYVQIEKWRNRQIDRQTDKWKSRQIDKIINGQKKSKNAEMARGQIDKLKDKQVNDITRIFVIFNSNFPSTVIFSKTFILSSQNH